MGREWIKDVGSIRTSQLLWNYGPGSLIDLPNLSVITMGLDMDIVEDEAGWDIQHSTTIEEPRLLKSVQRRLGPTVTSLKTPPIKPSGFDTKDAVPVGIPVEPFPRWLRCTRCDVLLRANDTRIRLRVDRFNPDRTEFQHKSCPGSNGSEKPSPQMAIPARLVLACSAGHIDDFPWHWYVHKGSSECGGPLKLYEGGSAIQTFNLMLSCTGCGKKRPIADAFNGDNGKSVLPKCRGRHPHLGTFSDCDQYPRLLSLGASNIWFPITLSALDIPISDYLGEDPSSLLEIKWPEWEVLIHPELEHDARHFRITETKVPKKHKELIEQVSLIERLREVNALVGFTRVDAPDEASDDTTGIKLVPLSRTKPSWVPAAEVFGEGIFIRFKETVMDRWETSLKVQQRFEDLFIGHKEWRAARNLPPGKGMPDMRYVMMHTLSHLLIREFALECGYNSSALKERIYANNDDAQPMAGILIYTAANDVDGTLGGLIELGRPKRLNDLLIKALSRATVCSSDPLCSKHVPHSDGTVHLAACHTCTFLSETSCERGNKYLDRALLVPTLEGHHDLAFFESIQVL